MVRVLSPNGVTVATARIAYQNRFPYVSTAFPFNGAGARHVGPNGQCLIENAAHEERMRRLHGYVGEEKLQTAVSFEKDRPPCPIGADGRFAGAMA